MNNVINRKGMTMGFLVAMIITLVAFVLISGTLFRFMSGAEDKQVELLCKDSVALRQFGTVKINDNEVKVAPVLCKTLDKKIKPKGTNLEQEKASVMTQFADNMARCWWMFGEGRYEKNLFDSLSVFGGKNKCFQCYSLLIEEGKYFEAGSTAENTISAIEFKDFLREKKYARSNTTYFDYFSRNGMVQGILSQEQGITPKRGYAVAYKARANECEICGTLGIGGGATTILSGLVIWAFPPSALVLVPVAVAGGGATYFGASGSWDDFFREVNIDTLYFVDMGSNDAGENQMATLFNSRCESIEAGAGGR